MRIALVCPYAWDRAGGVQSHVRALARVLASRGHEVQIIAPSVRKPPPETGVEIVGRAVGIPANGSVAPLSFGPRAAVGVNAALKRFEPEVMHLHEPLIPSLSLLALWKGRAPAVGTFHAAADRSRAYALGKPLLQRSMSKLAVRTAVSDSARALIGAYFPGDYALTPNGVEAARFADAEPLDLPGGRKVLFLGRIERRKGLEVLIQAMTRIRDLDTTLYVAGTGPQESSCRALAKNLGVRTEFMGRLSEEDLPRIYRSVDVYCAPGLGGESFGIVLAEAFAAGAAVVCSDLPGYRAVASGAATLVPPGDAGALADALRAVLTDDALATDMRKASKRITPMFDWERLVAGVEVIYERALTTTT
jgi:phosphatidylinositol alpha-mannosyltransferase